MNDTGDPRSGALSPGKPRPGGPSPGDPRPLPGPRQITVISGKGGTGKTTVTACLAQLAAPVVSADCDVDASNLALLMPGEDDALTPFVAGQRARVDAASCTGCGLCLPACRFRALDLGPSGQAVVDPLACEGCGHCRLVCPEGAVTLLPNQAGHHTVRTTAHGPLIHARLGIAQDNSGKLVARVRELARARAEQDGARLVLIDGPPGVGCPVHAAVTGVDRVVVVTEPTPSGAHDLERVLRLLGQFRLAAAVIINKADLSEHHTRRIEALADLAAAPLLATLPFDPAVPHRLARGLTPDPGTPFFSGVREAWHRLAALTTDR